MDLYLHYPNMSCLVKHRNNFTLECTYLNIASTLLSIGLNLQVSNMRTLIISYHTCHITCVIHVMVFWILILYSDVVGNQRFGGPCYLHLRDEVNGAEKGGTYIGMEYKKG